MLPEHRVMRPNKPILEFSKNTNKTIYTQYYFNSRTRLAFDPKIWFDLKCHETT